MVGCLLGIIFVQFFALILDGCDALSVTAVFVKHVPEYYAE
jgi:hypothetical protein